MLIAWNIRGLNKSGKIREISSHLLKFQADIVILVETRVKRTKSKAIRYKLNMKGEFMDNYNHHVNGKIWICWNSNKVDLKEERSSIQYIHCGVYDKSGVFKYWLTTIYALNQLEHMRFLWQQLEVIHSKYKGPWYAVGDFNNMASALVKIGGKLIVEAEHEDSNNMPGSTDMCEMESKGEFLTWSNKQSVNPIYSRIDRLIANPAWFQDNSELSLNVLSPHISYHVMVYLSHPNIPSLNSRRFRFNNSWTDIEGYIEVVKQS